MNELVDDIEDLAERCLATGHLKPEDAARVRQHLADGDPVQASVTLETSIEPHATSPTPESTLAVPTVEASTAAASSEGGH
jgi:hypothetical protein